MVSRNRNLDKRPNWFDRQFVRAQDFADGDDYALDRHRRHIRTLHTPGVAEGLRVSGDVGTTSVLVDAGTAIDALGREIVVLTALPPAQLPAGQKTAEVYLLYDEDFDDPSPDPGVEGFTRIREIASVAIRSGSGPVPQSPGDPPVPGILLATVKLDAGRLTAPPDNSVRSVAGAVMGVAAVDGISLRRPGHPASGYPRISADADTGDILFATGAPATERIRIAANGQVGISTAGPVTGSVTGALTVADPNYPLVLRRPDQTGAGGAWRTSLQAATLQFEGSAAGGDFTSTGAVLALTAGGGGSASRVTVAPEVSGVLQTRHIDGKAADSTADDALFLNWATGKDVQVGSVDHHANLQVHGEIGARNVPANDTTQALAALSVTSRLAGGTDITWKMYTAAAGGGFGVEPAAYEIWQYDTRGGLLRFAIHKDGNTYLTPRGGSLFISGAAYTSSDARLKHDVVPLTGVLGRLAGVRGVSFLRRDDPAADRRLGVLAHEVAAQFPDLVTVSARDGYQAVDYQGMTAVLIEAVKDLAAQVHELRGRLAAEPA
jgi:hypothetical protein